MTYHCINRDPSPRASRVWFWIDDSDPAAVYTSTTPDPVDLRQVDSRRGAVLTFDSITVPVAGDGRVLAGPGDMLAAAQACVAAGVRIFVNPRAIDAANATALAAGSLQP